ncbi:acyltransferase family protein [Limnoraphis robusta]|uniref:acyltransferase family protein n=1 Tax=Limnoraphis robusta TaxID=1118279 RepID=UPI002B214B23|nr:acyltransferase [Limnoraphis robusta]MEA5497635.1 acyltransferase [Limnoraphis robusta BA-68 BA1]
MKRLAYIDALRGIAIFSVLVVHTSQKVENLPNWLANLSAQGIYGVQIFFLISGFSIFLSFERRMNSEKKPLVNFFIRRFFRIAPLFYCAIILYLLLYGLGPRYWLGDASSVTLANIIANFTFTNGFNPYWINSVVPVGWAVAIEMQFYLIAPYLYRKIKNVEQAIGLTLIVLIFSQILIWILKQNPLISSQQLWNGYLYFFLPSQLPVFSLGFVLYFLMRNAGILSQSSKNETYNSENFVFRRAFLLLGIAIYLSLSIMSNYEIIPGHIAYSIVFLLLTLSLGFYSFPFLVNRFWIEFGKISYSIYLLHFAILFKLSEWFANFLSATEITLQPIPYFICLLTILLILTLPLCYLTYNFIEKNGIIWGNKLISNLEKKSE